MITYKIHLIRHGLTKANFEGRYVGQKTDIELCDKGKENLKKLFLEKEYPLIQKLYVSPMLRARQTADILYPDTYTEVVDNLKEYDFGDFENKTIAEIKDTEDFKNFIESQNGVSIAPNGEKTTDFNARCVAAFEHVFKDMMENGITNTAIITHGGVIMSILSQLSLPRKSFYNWATDAGKGYTVVLTPALWQRDEGFEVYCEVPYPLYEENFDMQGNDNFDDNEID